LALLTVGIPAYNEERFIAETLESLVQQTFTDWKAIVSDNCSTDRTYDIIRKYADKDNRIESVRHRTNIGAVENFKYGLNLADTRYFVWLGSHDIFHKDYLRSAIEVLELQKDVVMVFPNSLMINENGVEIGMANSDIQTLGEDLRKRLSKVVRNLKLCTALHGVFRLDILKVLPFKSVIGSDQLMLFAAASYGHLYMLPITGIKRRQIKKETYWEKKERWKRNNVYFDFPNLNIHSFLALEYFKFILFHKQISLWLKIKVLRDIDRILFYRYKVNKNDLLKAFIKKVWYFS
jgi:glycosyltransferase involved in cell wall biosynthesis